MEANDTAKTIGDLDACAAVDYREHKTASERDKLAQAHYDKRAELFEVGDFDRETIAVESYKLGWDARDKLLLKLHGEGAMADVIRLQQEVAGLKWQLAGADLEIKRLKGALEWIADVSSNLHLGRAVSFRDWELRQIAADALKTGAK